MKRDELWIVISMAFRNLGRHRIKTVITAVAVAVSVALFIFADSWLRGMNIDSQRNIILYEMGAAKVQTKAYFRKKDELPMYESFADWREIAHVLEEAGYICAPRFVFSGTIYSRSGSAPVICNAVDVSREKKLLRYHEFIEAGRFPRSGEREIVLGIHAAEKLGVGIPHRINRDALEEEIEFAASTAGEAAFIRSLYTPYTPGEKSRAVFAPEEDEANLKKRMVLRGDATDEDIQRLWNIFTKSGRMDVRISTTIDMKALPDHVDAHVFTRDILPLFDGTLKEYLMTIYTKDPVIDQYVLTGTDEKMRDAVLSRLIEEEYRGALRHVNQLISARVVGVVNSPNPKTNANVAYMPIDSLQDESGLMLDGHVTELLVRSASADDSSLPGTFESPEVIGEKLVHSRVGERFLDKKENTKPVLNVYGWKQYARDFLAAAAGDNVSTRVMIFFLFLLSFMGIANTMLMAILERTKEIGMLRALGMTDSQLLLGYVTEAAMVGVIGSTIGVIIGCLINIPMVQTGIDYSAVTEAMSGDIGYRIATHFRSTWNIGVIVGTFIVASLLSGCMAIIPTLRALKMPVTESLRFE